MGSSEIKPSSAVKDNSVYIIFKMVEMKGKYVRSSAENYDKFLDALGVGIILKKAATATTPEMTVEETDGEWTIKTSTMIKSMELKFKLGEKFDEKTPDGREVTSLVELDGNKLITTQTAKKAERNLQSPPGNSLTTSASTPSKSSTPTSSARRPSPERLSKSSLCCCNHYILYVEKQQTIFLPLMYFVI